ncbi:MAG TPA: hypothetical protein VFE20_06605 [Thermoleophilia bacterium]|nr:hypothetical protein [Thermoleophilia bacterium]
MAQTKKPVAPKIVTLVDEHGTVVHVSEHTARNLGRTFRPVRVRPEGRAPKATKTETE